MLFTAEKIKKFESLTNLSFEDQLVFTRKEYWLWRFGELLKKSGNDRYLRRKVYNSQRLLPEMFTRVVGLLNNPAKEANLASLDNIITVVTAVENYFIELQSLKTDE